MFLTLNKETFILNLHLNVFLMDVSKTKYRNNKVKECQIFTFIVPTEQN